MQAYSDPSRESDPYALPNIEVFHQTASEIINASSDSWQYERMHEDKECDADSLAGWYWWACFPGCLPILHQN